MKNIVFFFAHLFFAVMLNSSQIQFRIQFRFDFTCDVASWWAIIDNQLCKGTLKAKWRLLNLFVFIPVWLYEIEINEKVVASLLAWWEAIKIKGEYSEIICWHCELIHNKRLFLIADADFLTKIQISIWSIV